MTSDLLVNTIFNSFMRFDADVFQVENIIFARKAQQTVVFNLAQVTFVAINAITVFFLFVAAMFVWVQPRVPMTS